MEKYRNSFSEVYIILQYLNKEELNKIPQEVLEVIEENKNNDYCYNINEDLDLNEQEMLPETKALLFNLFRDYLSTPVQKEKILKMQSEDRIKNEKEKKERYISTNLFQKNEEYKLDYTENVTEKNQIVFYKENNIFKRFFTYIKNKFLKFYN